MSGPATTGTATGWCDNAVNGHRGRCRTEVEANALAADLELQYTVHGPARPGERSPRRPTDHS